MGWYDAIKGAAARKAGAWKASGLRAAQERKTPEILQRELVSAQRAMLGEFSSRPVDWVQRCMAQAKAARRQQRLALIDQAVGSCPDHVDTATRLRRDMDEVENMRCAKAVYGARDQPPLVPPGFTLATPAELDALGLKQNMLTPEGTNFTAAVYMKDPAVWGEAPEPAAVIAFRGSTTADEDWQNNFAQGINAESSYYRRAVAIGTALADGGGASAHIVGHSLGGGLASAAQGASGLTASTFNAAGLNPETFARYAIEGLAPQPVNIQALRVQGEVLTKTQEQGLMARFMDDAVGQKTDLAPATRPLAFEALKKTGQVAPNEDYATFLHGMDEVIGSMEARKSADEGALTACLQGAS